MPKVSLQYEATYLKPEIFQSLLSKNERVQDIPV